MILLIVLAPHAEKLTHFIWRRSRRPLWLTFTCRSTIKDPARINYILAAKVVPKRLEEPHGGHFKIGSASARGKSNGLKGQDRFGVDKKHTEPVDRSDVVTSPVSMMEAQF